MKKIYIYMGACILIGVLMMFRQSMRYIFMEDLNNPTTIDLVWIPPIVKTYTKKILLELHFFNPKLANDFISEKVSELKLKNLGVHTIVLCGSPKIDTNTYIRELAKIDWGIEEIRVHNTAAINIYAFINLIKSSSELKRVVIRNNQWDESALSKLKAFLKKETRLIVIKN